MLQFICIGTQKGGTTTLNSYLRSHPQLLLPQQDELHFFDDENQDWAAPDFAHYHRSFSWDPHHPAAGDLEQLPRESDLVCGEITPIYLYWLPSIERICSYNPSIKLIVLLRNPMARAYSHWAMEFTRGTECATFSHAIRAETSRCLQAAPFQHRIYSYIDRGRYHQQIKRLFRFFPREQVLMLRSENFFCRPFEALKEIQAFLGIAPFTPPEVEHKRKGSYIDHLCIEDWMYVYRELEGEISGLEELLGWDCSEWRVPSSSNI